MHRGLTKYLLLFGIGAALGMSAGWMAFYTPAIATSECFKNYSLTNKTIGCNEYEESLTTLYALDLELNEATQQYIASGKAERISIWARDLDTRLWASVNEFETYAPASLFKVPVMIAYFKLAEIQPTLLDVQIEYASRGSYEDQNFDPGSKLVAGQKYRVAELIEHMIQYSDNEAATLLVERLEPRVYGDILLDLGIRIPQGDGTTDFVTVKTYANIYRILYNSSYLTREYSQRALDILTKSSFKGIVEPLPAGVVAAHKFGERKIIDQNGTVHKIELHDCGIVYKKDRTYSLCIMTEGKSFDDLLTVIKEISSTVYENL